MPSFSMWTAGIWKNTNYLSKYHWQIIWKMHCLGIHNILLSHWERKKIDSTSSKIYKNKSYLEKVWSMVVTPPNDHKKKKHKRKQGTDNSSTISIRTLRSECLHTTRMQVLSKKKKHKNTKTNRINVLHTLLCTYCQKNTPYISKNLEYSLSF